MKFKLTIILIVFTLLFVIIDLLSTEPKTEIVEVDTKALNEINTQTDILKP
jgi:hypothetical protein